MDNTACVFDLALILEFIHLLFLALCQALSDAVGILFLPVLSLSELFATVLLKIDLEVRLIVCPQEPVQVVEGSSYFLIFKRLSFLNDLGLEYLQILRLE